MIVGRDVTYAVGRSGFYEAIPRADSIAGKDARIAWDIDDNRQEVEAVIVTGDAEEWSGAWRMCMSGGACYKDWMVPVAQRARESSAFVPDQCFNPAGTFGTMLSRGFVTKGDLRQALVQFAKIDNCEWARLMLFAIDGELSEKDLPIAAAP